MTLDGTYTATIDRIVADVAVILVEEDDEVVGELTTPVAELPEAAREEGVVLRATVADGELVDAEPRPDDTADRLEEARDRFERLSKRPPKKDDDEKRPPKKDDDEG